MALLMASNDLFMAEANRLINNAQCVVRLLVKKRHLIAGVSSAKTEASLRPWELLLTTTGLDSHCLQAYADALEVIPYTLAKNSGLKPMEIVKEMRKAHAEWRVRAGIEIKDGASVTCTGVA